ncbi:hypothetical protein GGI26_000485 [Coemansia sp. RSA 1358]|uniref:Uncharacterized protein n=1 Tax=Coemansia umbellata TaxID=1424467 RepID=A0ABQ8PVC0_9FUNG|nr:hypothetical protein EDC05_001122 [Coemansia umbellata]KAJ2625685.1 hypothetical protein GGI26_000485 [Coemansia sp. RSA 1358]
MKYLEIDCVNEAAICNYCDSLPALEHLYLVQFNHVFYESNSEVHDPSLSHILNSALVIGSLRSYISWSSFLASCRPLELTFINHQLRTLNISTWAIGFCGLLLLLSRLPAPEEIRVILADPQIYPASEDISCNLSIKRMCLDTNLGKINPWVHSSYESLISIFKHILSLKELLLFSKTHQWLEGAILQQTDKELLRLIQTVTVGQCNRDEKRTYIQSLVCIL